MSPSELPIPKPRESRGTQRQSEHPEGRQTTVSVHKGRDTGPGLLRKILRDIELTPEELHDWL